MRATAAAGLVDSGSHLCFQDRCLRLRSILRFYQPFNSDMHSCRHESCHSSQTGSRRSSFSHPDSVNSFIAMAIIIVREACLCIHHRTPSSNDQVVEELQIRHFHSEPLFEQQRQASNASLHCLLQKCSGSDDLSGVHCPGLLPYGWDDVPSRSCSWTDAPCS